MIDGEADSFQVAPQRTVLRGRKWPPFNRLPGVDPAVAGIACFDASPQIEAAVTFYFQKNVRIFQYWTAQTGPFPVACNGQGKFVASFLRTAPFAAPQFCQKGKSTDCHVFKSLPLYRGNAFGQQQGNKQYACNYFNGIIKPCTAEFVRTFTLDAAPDSIAVFMA